MDSGAIGDKAIRVLLIDQDPAEYALIGQLLSAVGPNAYELTWCRQSGHALEAIAADLHDVILLDYQSDRVKGSGLLAKAVQHNCTRPIIVMTDEMDRNVDREAIRSGSLHVRGDVPSGAAGEERGAALAAEIFPAGAP